MLRVSKILKKFIMVSHPWYDSFDIFVVALPEKHFASKVMILAPNWPNTAKSSWQCPFKLVYNGGKTISLNGSNVLMQEMTFQKLQLHVWKISLS